MYLYLLENYWKSFKIKLECQLEGIAQNKITNLVIFVSD